MLIILLCFSACSSYQSTNKRSTDDVFISQLSIFGMQAKLIDTTYMIIGYTKSIPGRPIKKIKDFVYEITLSIKVNGINTYWNSPFDVILILPNGKIATYVLNEEEFTLSSSFIEDFRFIVETPQKGTAKCALSLVQQSNELRLTDYDWQFLNLN